MFFVNHLPALFFAEGASASVAQAAHASEHTLQVFIIEIILMLLFGRLLGELMHRIGQPAVMGQLIAGILIGPSVFGQFFPHAYQVVFPNLPEQKKMIDAISQLGILMLLLLTGMETDLALVKKMRHTAFFTSMSGIIFPFVCGYAVGHFLPESMLPRPEMRVVTALFIATALSISSVKIVAMVIMEVDFMRRNIGQIILASAILDDTIGWIIIAVIGGIATSGTVNFMSVGSTLLFTLAFLALSFTIGRRFVAGVIRWTNDHMLIEKPVITAILILMLLMALLTDWIGVHTVLGAFVVGILVGQSPILTKHIEEQVRGLIVALFAPIFFAVAGREIDLTILRSFYLVKLAIGFILIASFGKVVGCYIGGRLGQLGHRASVALAIGMNARGSTEVIVATIGLSMGVLTRDLFTLIVVMAIATTLVTPPLLRWALTRIPPTGEEKQRLEREEAEAQDFVPKVERILVTVDQSENGRLASVLAGLFAGTRKIMTTLLELGQERRTQFSIREQTGDIVKTSIEVAARSTQDDVAKSTGAPPVATVETPTLINQISPEKNSAAILNESRKGYDMIFLGVNQVLEGQADGARASEISIEEIAKEYKGVISIVIARGHKPSEALAKSMNILVPTTGADYSRRAAEVAIAIAKASKARITAMHVAPPLNTSDLLHPRQLTRAGRALVKDIQSLGEREGVKVTPIVKSRKAPEAAILRQVTRGRHDLVVLGVKLRPGQKAFFGHRSSILLEETPCSMLIINS